MDYANGQCQAFLREVKTRVVHSLSQTERTEIGRALNCQIVLNSPLDNSISRHHAEVRPLAESGEWEICPLGSNKDIYVNGQRLSGSYTLQTDDILTFGRSPTELIFEIQIEKTLTPIDNTLPNKTQNFLFSNLSPSSLLPLLSKWSDVEKKRYLRPAIFFSILCILGAFFKSINQIPISNVLFAGCILAIAIETLSQVSNRYKPEWLILGLALTTGGVRLMLELTLFKEERK
jgi:hypothetical protein